jgi:drug/metabolite transporter (DMT)-like permease
MADETTLGETTAIAATPQHTAREHAPGEHPQRSEALAFAIGVAGWLVPGLGHALQKMWGRALGCFLTVGALVFLGVGMRGNLFSSEGGDAFGILGYVADLGTGSFYFAARALETQGSDVAHAEGDYGTRFLAAAGVLNLLAALHAYEAARGRKA